MAANVQEPKISHVSYCSRTIDRQCWLIWVVVTKPHRTVNTTGQSGDRLITDCYDGKMMWLVAARRFLVSRAANVKYAHGGITTLSSASAGL